MIDWSRRFFAARSRSVRSARAGLAVAGLVTLNALAVLAGDWPQILGPQRNGEAQGERLFPRWPEAGPKLIWQAELGEGFAGPAVVGQRVIVFHRVGDKERVEALDAATGKQLWQTDFNAAYRGGINPDRGPRCVPTVQQGQVYAMGAAGDLHCLRLEDGKAIWSRDTWTDFDAPEGYFGAGSSPIVLGDRVLVNVGGRKQAGIVAFGAKKGKTLWAVTEEAASYSSPALTNIDGQPIVIFVARLNTLFVDPRDGRIVLRFPFGQRGPTVNAAMPITQRDRLFVTASYGIGAQCLKFNGGGLQKVWGNDQSLSSQYSTPVRREPSLFGIHGREDVGRAELRCIDFDTGRVRWSVSDFGVANLILSGDKLLVLSTEGKLRLIAAQAEAFEQLDEASVADSTTRALPALANGRLFFRTNDATHRGGRLLGLQVGESR